KDLLVAQPLVDQRGDFFAHHVGHAAAVRIATGQGVEMAGANVAWYAAGAIDAGQEPLDALTLAAGQAYVGRKTRFPDGLGRGRGGMCSRMRWPGLRSA